MVRYVHTHFLRFQHTLSECYVSMYVVIFSASFFGANGVVELPYGVILCDVCSGSLPDFPFPGAMLCHIFLVPLCPLSRKISFPSIVIAVS
jgi:hypothetical protein